MDKKLGGIYAITSRTNGKRYVGSAVCFHKRWGQHIGDLKKNKHHSEHLQKHTNKYGLDDLVFTIIEVVDRDVANLSIKEYRDKLLSVEQTYLDQWSCCEFNIKKTAIYNGSNAGQKHSKAKYYTYNKNCNRYTTFFVVNEKHINFSFHVSEANAIREVEYLKTLTDEQLLEYKKECLAKPRRKQESRHYKQCNNKNKPRWVVNFKIGKRAVEFGRFALEEDAIDEVEYLKTLSDDEKLDYKKNCMLGIYKKKVDIVAPVEVETTCTELFVEEKVEEYKQEDSNIYYYKRKVDLFAVVNNNEPELYFKTLEAAKQKVAELKGEYIPAEYTVDDFVDKVWTAYKHKKRTP